MASVQDEMKWYFDASSKIKDIYDNNREEWITNLKLYFEKELPLIQSKLPWLNETPLHNLRTNQLVRFRGMIQDMLNPEFYMDVFVIKNGDGEESNRPGRYMDAVYCKPNETIVMDSPTCVMRDRNSYLCISIPGENNWVKQIYEQLNPQYKLSFSDVTMYENKRSFQEDIESESFLSYNDENRQQEGKKFKSENFSVEKASDSEFEHFPFPNSNGVGCLLKTYEDYDVSLNDIVEVVGILSMDPISECEKSDSFNDSITVPSEIKERSLPASLIPRLHVISFVKRNHCNPLLPMVMERNSSCSFNIRELIGAIFDVAFLGDELAAEYFICHLISTVYIRQGIIPIGKFSINLSGITLDLQEKNYMKLLYTLIENLTTQSYYFPMTIENMNNVNFVPKKDYETNCLKSGILQVSKNLHLVVDETVLTCGNLDSKGISNLTSLKNLLDWQKVDYEFQFHKLEQLADVPVIILSEGKSMLNCDFHIKLDPKHRNVCEAFAQVEALLTEEVLDNIRKHLTLCRVSSYTFEQNMQKRIQDDFVASRRNEGGMTEEDLHKLLSLAKLLAQSCGKEKLDEDIWKSAKLLEAERKGRIIDHHS